MIDNFIGVWLPKEATVLFKDHRPNFVNLLKKAEDDKYQIVLGTLPDFEAEDFEQFYVLRVPEIPLEESEDKEEQNEDNESGASGEEGEAESAA